MAVVNFAADPPRPVLLDQGKEVREPVAVPVDELDPRGCRVSGDIDGDDAVMDVRGRALLVYGSDEFVDRKRCELPIHESDDPSVVQPHMALGFSVACLGAVDIGFQRRFDGGVFVVRLAFCFFVEAHGRFLSSWVYLI